MYFYMKMEELKVFYDFDIGMWRKMGFKVPITTKVVCFSHLLKCSLAYRQKRQVVDPGQTCNCIYCIHPLSFSPQF